MYKGTRKTYGQRVRPGGRDDPLMTLGRGWARIPSRTLCSFGRSDVALPLALLCPGCEREKRDVVGGKGHPSLVMEDFSG